MASVTKFEVMWLNPFGRDERNACGFDTCEEADTYVAEMEADFPEERYYSQPYEERVPYAYERGGNSHTGLDACDGWEDIYPDRG